MKTLIIGFILLASTTLFAANKGYELNVDFSKDKKSPASFQILVLEGKTATHKEKINDEEFFIEVAASEGQVQQTKGTLMKFIVGTIATNGKKTIIGTPEILAPENDMTKKTITVGDEKNSFSLSVIVKKKLI